MSNNSGSSSQVISLPQGGGALKGIGEKFSPDLHTGTGNFTIPISLPTGRNGLQPQLDLTYSTGNGNGLFGFGWNLSVPGVARKTSKGIPRYRDYDQDVAKRDTFILSGAEDLVPIADQTLDGERVTRYCPRTEVLFARIIHNHDAQLGVNYWQVSSKDGLISFYGTPPPDPRPEEWADSSIIRKHSDRPGDPDHIFAWKLTLTKDPFDNRIEYLYDERDQSLPQGENGHRWDQPLLKQIRYADYTEGVTTKFLITVTFLYENRLDQFSDYRAGFEIRTTKRCKAILIQTNADQTLNVRRYEFGYSNDSLNQASQLTSIDVVGFDDGGTEHRELPSLKFGYTDFNPQDKKRRDFYPIQGTDFPATSLAHSSMELVDLFGNGLPDILEMNGSVRYWRNRGNGRFEVSRPMVEAPAGVALSNVGVQLIDANGDGRADLLVTQGTLSGYYPLQFGGLWDHRSFQKYQHAPSFDLKDPEVRLIDLTGDGVTDVLRSGTRLECFFNDPHEGWAAHNTRWVERKQLEVFPNVSFSDSRIKLADMTGDGLQDIVLVHRASVDYWPNLGYGNWGARLHMRNSPALPEGYDPARILIGDVDGDGLADIIYVDNRKVTLWINQGGNSWSSPIEIAGTPQVSDTDAVRLIDLLGNGISGVLWTRDATADQSPHYFFLDLTGGVKPYLLHEMNNHMGALTKVEYAPSTRYYLDDQMRPELRWKTPLPFPVHVVARVEVIDEISMGKLTTEYRYHNGYWDGAEREFRGFGMVEQFDSESFNNYVEAGLHGTEAPFAGVGQKHFSHPTLTKTWFQQGPIGEEFGEWSEQDWSNQYWQGDPQLLKHTQSVNAFLQSLGERRAKRDALRTLRGSILRTELYAIDGDERAANPYTVTENAYGMREEEPPSGAKSTRPRIYFPHLVAQRTTQWERGDDPLTQFTFTGEYDAFGQPRSQTTIAMPRRARKRRQISALEVADETGMLATHSRTTYAEPQDGSYIHDRTAAATNFEVAQKREITETNPDGVRAILFDQAFAAAQLHTEIENILRNWQPEQGEPAGYRIFGHTVNKYDGVAYEGEPLKKLGKYGAVTRSESLIFTDDILNKAYGSHRPTYLGGSAQPPAGAPANFGTNHGYAKKTNSAGYVPGYYISTKQQKFDFQTSANAAKRGLIVTTRDPLGSELTITEYSHELLPMSVRDPAGLEIKAHYNHRVMQPFRVTDPNGNFTEVEFSPLGLVTAKWVKGKNGEGDQTRPGVKLEYDFLAFETRADPIVVRTIRHVNHDTESGLPQSELNRTIASSEFSDGFGRLLQTRTQGEEVRFGDQLFGGGEGILPAKQSDGRGGPITGQENPDATKPNVIVSGWQVYDNKGRVVEKYEPFFSTGWDYLQPAESQRGQKAKLFYDPRGHVIRTQNPDGSEQHVVHGVPADLADPSFFNPTPWEAYSYDENDNAGRTHAAVSQVYRHHYNTPASILIDALGRTLMAVERNRPKALAAAPFPAIEELRTLSTYDIQGNVLTVADALGRVAFTQLYDFAKRPLQIQNIDAGDRWIVTDAAGNLIEGRDSKGAIILHAYDVSNRPVRTWARDGTGQTLTLRSHILYGDDSASGLTRTDALARNLLGKPYQHYDEAGQLAFEKYDFKGNLLEKSRRVISDAKLFTVLSPPPANWDIKVFRVDWQPPPGTAPTHAAALLDANVYTTSLAYDALNRVTTMKYPVDIGGVRQQLRTHYNRAGTLESVKLNSETYVEHIAYNAKGQRTLIAYGNGVLTRYAHNHFTSRLVRMRTERYTKPGVQTYAPGGTVLQDFAYEYDVAGNILKIHDRTPASGVLNTQLGVDALDRDFEYDPLYRLLSATGRETGVSRPATQNKPWDDPPHSTDQTLARPYTETLQYDAAGNTLRLDHAQLSARGNTVISSRRFALVQDAAGAPVNNRLATVTAGTDTYRYRYDDNGNLIQENNERHFEWDHSDRMRVFRNQTTGARPTTHAQYLYDATGQRVKKYVVNQQREVEITINIDGLFEHHLRGIEQAGTVRITGQNNSLHVMDNQTRIAMVRVGPAFPDDGAPNVTVKYQLRDHLGSSNIVVGGATAAGDTFINREEYTPYGETSFGSFARKRYRFTGKERDEESGLYYHGARYYVPWLARWISCDPKGNVDGVNLYKSFVNNPIRYFDPAGYQSADTSHVSSDADLFSSSDAEKETVNMCPATPPVGSALESRTYYKFVQNPTQRQILKDAKQLAPMGELKEAKSVAHQSVRHASPDTVAKEGTNRISFTKDPSGALQRAKDAGAASANVVKVNPDEIKNAGGQFRSYEELWEDIATYKAERAAASKPPQDSLSRMAERHYYNYQEGHAVGMTPVGTVRPIRWWDPIVFNAGRALTGGLMLLGGVGDVYYATQSKNPFYVTVAAASGSAQLTFANLYFAGWISGETALMSTAATGSTVVGLPAAMILSIPAVKEGVMHTATTCDDGIDCAYALGSWTMY